MYVNSKSLFFGICFFPSILIFVINCSSNNKSENSTPSAITKYNPAGNVTNDIVEVETVSISKEDNNITKNIKVKKTSTSIDIKEEQRNHCNGSKLKTNNSKNYFNNKSDTPYDLNAITTNILVGLIVNRGILSPSCGWWKMNDLFLKDKSGVNFYYKMKGKIKNPFIPINVLGETIYLITKEPYMKQLLNKSPDIFGVGKYKRRIFQSFMKDNVGISHDKPWYNRRKLNVKVLETDKLHHLSEIYNKNISNILDKKLPKNFDEFVNVGKQIVSKLVFNDPNGTPDEVFNIFGKANSMKALLGENFKIDSKTMNAYISYLEKNIDNPNPDSLIYLAVNSISYCPHGSRLCKEELIQQIPHWIFPTMGMFHSIAPRLLLILYNHPEKLEKVIKEIKNLKSIDAKNIYEMKYLRKCVLEIIRLNNAVVTTFRTLREDYDFGNGYNFKKGTQFLILNNPVLRDPKFFPKPDEFAPERWINREMENSYKVLMFNQGNQKCPGKELAIFKLQSFIVNYLTKSNYKIKGKKIDVNNIPQMINPCTIKFE